MQGRVAVNGKVMTRLPILVDPEVDRITVDDEPIRLKKPGVGKGRGELGDRHYILLNKPKGVYTTNVAQGEQMLAIDLLGPEFPARVYPVGRLDAESTGLLLLTNDGALTNKLTHARYGVAKTYLAVVEGQVTDADIAELEKGVWLADKAGGRGYKARASRIKISRRLREKTLLEITLREGHNRQVQRMLAKVGHKVRELSRIRMGPLTLEGLRPGKFRSLTGQEVRALREYADRKPEEKPVSSQNPRKSAKPAPERQRRRRSSTREVDEQ